MMDPFVHLRVHSSYSLLEGMMSFETIMDHVLQDRSPAVAITDTNNLFGALDFAQQAVKKGIQPIVGIQIDFSFEGKEKTSFPLEKKQFPLILLAATELGYSNLMRMISAAYLDSSSDHFVAPSLRSVLGYEEGIICLTGGSRGFLPYALKQGNHETAEQMLLILQSLFKDRLYVELERIEEYDQTIEEATIDLAYKHSLPLVAVNEAFFRQPEDFDAHDALLAIAEGCVLSVEDRRRVAKDNYLKSSHAMHSLFADIPEALANTVEIARRCSYYPSKREPMLPRFFIHEPTDDIAIEDCELFRQAHEGLKERLSTRGLALGHCLEEYDQRLAYELSVIKKMKYSGYFLIVSDFVKWAKQKNIPVGPGRGSGAGSLVAYAIMITDIDPLRFSLLFERFLNPDRVSMPDFDIDFCQDRREEVISYVKNKYGADQVAQIITFGSLQARAVLRDVGRVLQIPYSQVDRLCKLIPNNPTNPMNLQQMLDTDSRFLEEIEKEPIMKTLIFIGKKLEGVHRHASTHAAGIVIGDRPLRELVPLYRDSASDMPVTQFNMKKVEDAGLVKFDFLGLKTLTVLQKTIDLLSARGLRLDLANIPLDDQNTYALLSKGDVFGVFQLESAGMQKALIGMKPDRIEDIIALVALYRPGPLQNIPTYNARKNGQETIISIHPKIDHILSETQGVIIYQEQVMQIAQELAGYSLAEADLLRRAMGKKDRLEMNKQRKRFISGALKRDLTQTQADFIFDLLSKFANYGFNKSHAAAYAIISYQTAYLKAHFPVEFMAASMAMDISNTARLAEFRRDSLRLGIRVLLPSVLSSFSNFQPEDDCIYYALSAIKGIGKLAADYIVEQREKKLFEDLFDFCARMDPSIIGKRVLEALIMSGALDCFGYARARMASSIDWMLSFATRTRNNSLLGQEDIFQESTNIDLPAFDGDWSTEDRLRFEFQTIGFYLSAHPLDSYQKFLHKMSVQTYVEALVAVQNGQTFGKLAATVILKQERKTKTGHKIAIVTLSDPTGQYEAILFSESLQKYGDLFQIGVSLLLHILYQNSSDSLRFQIQSAQPIEEEIHRSIRSVSIYIDHEKAIPVIAQKLLPNGDKTIIFILIQNKKEIEIKLPDQYRIDISFLSSFKDIVGVVDVLFF